MSSNIVDLLDSALGEKKIPSIVKTDLKSISGKSNVLYNEDWTLVLRLENRIERLKRLKFSDDNIRHLQLLDEYQSATIEGARTTIDKVLSGGLGKSEIMVRQSLAGLLYLLNNDFNEENMLTAWRIITEGCCENISAGINGYRTGMVYVGSANRIIHIPAIPENITDMMKDLFSYSSKSYLQEAIVYSFYLVYVHPFADGNGRLSRAIIQKKIGLPALPLSKAISVRLGDYYRSLSKSEIEIDGRMDISAYAEFIINAIDRACDMYELYAKPLNDTQSLIISKMDKIGKGYIGYNGVTEIVGYSIDEAVKLLNELVDLGYLEYSEEAGGI